MTCSRRNCAASRFLSVGLVGLLLTACASQRPQAPAISSFPALQTSTGEVSVPTALASASTPDLLGLSAQMRDFADRYVNFGSQRQRLLTLHSSLLSPGLVDIRYDPAADGTAAEAFARSTANCLSYAHLFVAMARYVGLDARYLDVSLRPEWARHGDRVALQQHINVVVKLRSGEQYVVDIDPVPREKIASAQALTDAQAAALHHSNLAMDALLAGSDREAFSQAVRALQLGSELDYLWVNIGAIYRRAGQDDSAEHSYEVALLLNPQSASAMNNLAVLYAAAGDPRAAQWTQRLDALRQHSPYYYAHLGETAELAGDTEAAIAYYLQAIERKNTDAEFYYRLAKLHLALQQTRQSIRYTKLAIEHATLVGERELYQNFLGRISDPSLAQLAP